MADLRESFPTLEDGSTGEGKVLVARQEGDAAASQNGAIGFAFKDASGNVILPALDAAGNVKVLVDHQDLEGDASAGKEGLVAFTHKDSTGDLVLPQLDANGNSKVIIDHVDVEGDAAAGKEGLVAFGFKDSSGNLVLPQLDASGNVKISFVDRACLKSPAGELAAGSGSLAAVTGAEITLATSTSYDNIGFVFSSRRDALFQLIQQDDATDTVIFEGIVGPGQYTLTGEMHCLKITTGASGAQKLKVKAKNFESLSSLRATITAQVA
jgi:hypothetical protein